MKKLISTLLLCALLLTTAACASDATDDTAGTTAANVETTEAGETTEPPEYVAPEGIDYGGKTFTVAANQWANKGWRLAEYCEILAEEENGEPINDAIYQRNRTVEEELNVKFALFPIPKMSSHTEIMTAVLAGDDMFYFAAPNGTSMPAMLGSQDIFVNLTDIDTFDIEASWWDAKSADEFRIYDKQYAVAGDFNFYNNGAPICNFFSKKLVENLNLDDPYDVVRNGEWTLDVYFEYAEAAARDVNGDGVMTAEEDCWGLFGEWSTISQLIRSCGQRISTRTSDGDVEIVVNTEKTADIVERFIPFMRNKNINIYASDYANQYSSVYIDLFLPKFIDNGAMFFANQVLVALELRNMESDFGILPMPKYDETQDDYVSTLSNSWATFVFVPITCSDLSMTGNVLNALGYYSQQLITPAFIDQTVMNKAIRDDDTAEMLELIFDRIDYDIATIFDWAGVLTGFNGMLEANNVNFASTYAQNEEKILTALEATMDQLR